jgi:hypothetical protein
MEIATGMVLLADDRRVVGNGPIIATVPQRPTSPGEAIARVHEAAALIPLHADVVIVLGLLQGDAAIPLLLAGLLLLVVDGARLELALFGCCLRGEGAVEGGPGLLHLPCGDEGLLAPPPVSVLLKDIISKPWNKEGNMERTWIQTVTLS